MSLPACKGFVGACSSTKKPLGHIPEGQSAILRGLCPKFDCKGIVHSNRLVAPTDGFYMFDVSIDLYNLGPHNAKAELFVKRNDDTIIRDIRTLTSAPKPLARESKEDCEEIVIDDITATTFRVVHVTHLTQGEVVIAGVRVLRGNMVGNYDDDNTYFQLVRLSGSESDLRCEPVAEQQRPRKTEYAHKPGRPKIAVDRSKENSE